ncbi:PREDICTED: uncharacterized protein LOC109188202 [Ipomoea nil]|uniref:uncharacterized protein LOC109188202 n=1 Tax=Ipomoea nil TaxID=35883 RepID=UPI0009011308|nr:PREDICTED: uncharacterized protein LOC109188202 [Ipomoea nil]
MEFVASLPARRLSVLPPTTISTPTPPPFISPSTTNSLYSPISTNYNANNHRHCIKRNNNNTYRLAPKIHPVTDVISAAAITSDAAATPVEITWQIIVGTIAGVTPFIVAGIEFGKRIVAQRRCTTCGGSGLVLRETDYFRCPTCGGFLPWQSWKRFFTG